MGNLFFLLIIIWGGLFFGDGRSAFAEEQKPKESQASHSVAPIGGYNPTYKAFLGLGYFYEKEDFQWSTLFILTFQKIYRLEKSFEVALPRQWRLLPSLQLDFGFEPNYGSGSDTDPHDRTDVFGRAIRFKALAAKRWGERWEVKFGYGFERWTAFRTEGPEKNTIPSSILHSFLSEWSYTKKKSNDQGWTASLSTDVGHSEKLYVKAASSFRLFVPLGGKVIVASHSKLGSVFGSHQFHTDFTLGGTDRLRGFLKNRFRGKKTYLQQFEVRYPIYGPLGGVTFFDLGEATHDDFRGPRMSYGGGLRYGLPPDQVEKIRVDIGKSVDQFGIFFDFGQSF